MHLKPSFYKIWHGDCGTVYSASLRQQLQDVGKKLVGALHYNKDGSINGRYILSQHLFVKFHSQKLICYLVFGMVCCMEPTVGLTSFIARIPMNEATIK